MTTTDPLRRIVEDRVEELLRWRTWYRMHRSINLAPIEQLHNAELRALVRLLRAARLQEKADTVWHAPEPRTGYMPGMTHGTGGNDLSQPEQADPVTAAKSYWDWVSGR